MNTSVYDSSMAPILEIGLTVEYDDFQELVRALESGADEVSLIIRGASEDDLSFLD